MKKSFKKRRNGVFQWVPGSPLLTLASVFLCGFALLSCGKQPSSTDRALTLSGLTMGTYYRVTLASLPDTVSEELLQASISTHLERINSLMSTYISDSEVSRFNRSGGTNWFPVSVDTATVVADAIQIFELSGGAFDITVSPLVNLWGFGPPERNNQIPSQSSIEKTLNKIGSQHLRARLSPPALKKNSGDLQIDLSGIAKGFAVDSVAESLEALEITNYLVNIGGEMLASGQKEDASFWRVAIESPTANQIGIQRVLELRDLAIATSGDYRNYFEVDNRSYSHEIDPRTGRPIQHQLVSVSVLDVSCRRADAWATALIILGPNKGRQLAESANLAAFFIVRGDDGFLEMESPGFNRLSSLP